MLHIQSRTKLSETTMSDSAGFRRKKKSQDPQGSVKKWLGSTRLQIWDSRFYLESSKNGFFGIRKTGFWTVLLLYEKKIVLVRLQKKVDKKLKDKGIKTPA